MSFTIASMVIAQLSPTRIVREAYSCAITTLLAIMHVSKIATSLAWSLFGTKRCGNLTPLAGRLLLIARLVDVRLHANTIEPAMTFALPP
jgi:hypothetical protein